MAGRCLIVANQTLGGAALDRAVEECVERGDSLFYVVVPMTPVEKESAAWGGGFDLSEAALPERTREAVAEQAAREYESKLEDARNRAEQRLRQMIERIRSLGGEAEGEVGADDPLEASRAVLERQAAFDRIIVSTLPAGLSRWLKMDLPSRVSRLTEAPVTTIEAEA